ncbi:hypothetical protein F2Q70_00004606 [Brassica cretica]|uniref:Uncharacterized protein n=1 Tax=Brassica cretica TaxID=69181 RepID=A0A8S9J4D6_BRACR|nr:hypothetical protein F2Q70_00004606 [Brassica cretica]
MSTKLELLKSAYTNKQTGQIQDPLIKDVVDLVESRVEDILMTQKATCEDQSTVSSANSLTRDQLNNHVLEAVPKKRGRYVGLDCSISTGGSSASVHCPIPVQDLIEQIKNKNK